MDLVSEAQKSAVLAVLIDYLLNENISSLDEDIKKLDYECEQYRIAEELRQLISNSKPGRGYVTGEKHKRDDSIPEIVYARLDREKLYPQKMSASIGLFPKKFEIIKK